VESVKWSALRKSAEDSVKPLPDGQYNVKVEKAEAVKSSTGKDMLKLVVIVEDGPHAGRRLWPNFVLSPESPFAMNLFFQNLAGFGLDEDFFTVLEESGLGVEDSLALVAEALVGRTASGTTTQREFKNRVMNDIDGFKVGGSAANAPVSTNFGGGGGLGGAPAISSVGLPGGGLPGGALPSTDAPKINF
jgi:hypothetical protein